MILSTKITYSVRALAYLALHAPDEGFLSLTQVANGEGISLNYLAHLFSRLRARGVIESVRGRRGGYRLARPAGEISLQEIIDAVDMGDFLNLNLPPEVEDQSSCRMVTDLLWTGFDHHVRHFLSDTTLASVLEKAAA